MRKSVVLRETKANHGVGAKLEELESEKISASYTKEKDPDYTSPQLCG
jgi:hypothetical protein